MTKKNKFPIFVITLIIGLGIIGFALFEADFDVGTLTSFGLIDVPTLGFIDVPIDPSTGGILGTIVLGAPDEIPFEQAGTVFGIPFSQSRSASPRSFCTDNFLALDGIGTTKNSSLALRDPNDFNRVILMPPDFERRLSGERNQLDPVWWGSKLTDSTTFPIFSGVASYTCAFAYAQWDIVDIPNDFVVTSAVLKLQVLEIRKATNLTFQIASQQCTITLQDFNLDTIADEGIMNKVWKIGGVSTPLTIVSGTWCNSLGVKTFQLSQSAVDLINDAISGGEFGQGTRADKLLLGFMPTRLNNEAQQFNVNKISTQFWKTEGAIFLTGSSPPIKCDIGFNQVDFRCVPIFCDTLEQLNLITNQCELIQCPSGENIELIEEQLACVLGFPVGEEPTPCPVIQRAVCTPIQCQIGESLENGTCERIICLEGTDLIGSTCQPVFCGEGFEISGNQCVVKTCSTGMELINDNCQPIVCPTNTILNGNDCFPLVCPTGHNIIDNECVSVTEGLCIRDGEIFPLSFFPPECEPFQCDTGFEAVGNVCLPILDCPSGTVPFENNCRQIVPDLLNISGINPSMFLIIGFVIAGISTVGIAVRRR